MTTASALLYAGSAAVCLVWTLLILASGRGRTARLLAAACGIAALWALAVALTPGNPLGGAAGLLEVMRWLVWGALLLVLYGRVAGPGGDGRRLALGFATAAAPATATALVFLLLPAAAGLGAAAAAIAPFALLARLGLALLVVLLAENLYRNAEEAERWHVGLPCIALGGLGAFDVVLYADAALSRGFSAVLVDARAALTALATPLLAIAAARDSRWRRDPPVSRQVVFHGATLVVAGAFLLAIGALGEGLRRFDLAWGPTAQVSLIAAALIALAVATSARSVRSRLRRLVVDPFFTARYDYRREWLRCADALSAADDGAPPEHRAIRAIADAVDSPAGVLLQREAGPDAGSGLRWAGSWNLPAEFLVLPEEDPLPAALRGGQGTAQGVGVAPGAAPGAVLLATPADGAPPGAPAIAAPPELLRAYGPLWLAVPLPHGREGLAGLVLLAPPRAPFALDAEVFELLRTIGREVAMFLAERRAAERLVDERRLQDYAKRFAFVAHDVKTVSSQLSLLLANAEENLQDPEFQHDMLLTVRAAAARINALILRLGQPGDVPMEAPGTAAEAAPGAGSGAAPSGTAGGAAAEAGVTEATGRLRALAAAKRPHPVIVEAEEVPRAAIAPARFDTAIGHLLNNAVEASPAGEAVRIRVGAAEAGRILVEIIDRGSGMTPEFVRDALFRPLRTSKRQGSGIGAWQARELLREAGGELVVLSRPGAGTTMRVLLPAAPGTAAQRQEEEAAA